MGDRLLIVNADDYGLTPGVSRGILTAHRDGIVTSTTALAVGPAFAGHADALRDSGLAAGAHLAAVGEDPPVLSAAEVPSLVDRTGRFPLTWTDFLSRAVRGGVDRADLDREFAAQVEVLRGAGLTLTHVDAHQNLHLWPPVRDSLLALARREGIGAVRVTRTARWSPRSLGVRTLSRALRRRARRAGLVFPAASTGLDQAGHLTPTRLTEAVDHLRSGGVGTAELAAHPGEADDPDRVRYAWGYRWPDELATLCAPASRDLVERAGFTLGTFADLVARTGTP